MTQLTELAIQPDYRHEQELIDYRQAELGTPGYFDALRNRWEAMRVGSYPSIENPVDAEAFANSRRHTADFLCSPETVDALLALAPEDPTLDTDSPAATAVNSLAEMMGALDNYRDRNNMAEADDATVLASMRTRFYRGDMSYAHYTNAFNMIREQGTAYLAARLGDIDPARTISRYEGSQRQEVPLREVAMRAIQKNTELEQGTEFNEEFIDDLERTQAFILSLDINGATFTLPDQVTPNAQMISIVSESINLLREEYANTFPGRRAYVIPNTGMGGNYARGVIETAGPMIADAVYGESGGVEVVRNGDATSIELTLEHPDLYLMALKRIESNVQGSVANKDDMVTAPKDSMSSLMVRDPHTGEPLLTTADGTAITEDVVQMMMMDSAAEILEEIDDPQLRAQMEQVLKGIVVDYNPAVGFVDIHREGISKFYALRKFAAKQGLALEDITTVHIGDSTVDAPAVGEADSAFIVGLANSKAKLKERVNARGAHGIHTHNEAIIGVINTVNGTIGALQEIKRRRAMQQAA